MKETHPGTDRRRAIPPAMMALSLLALLLGVGLLASELYLLDGRLGFPLDDSWIHLAFARNLAAGHGLSINPGELVAGSTAPLWTALVALGVALPVSDLLWMKLLGLGFHLAGGLLTLSLARALGLDTRLSVLAAGLMLGTGWLAWGSVSGMEIPLFVVLSLAAMVLHLRELEHPERPPLSLGLIGLSVLARPEGLVLLGCAVLDRCLRFRRLPDGALGRAGLDRAAWARIGSGIGLACLAFLPVAAFYQWIGGSPLPTTLAAKTGGGSGLHLPELRYLHLAAGVLFRSQPWMTVLAPAGAVELARRLGTSKDRGLLPVLWLAALPLGYSCITPPGAPLLGNFGRYLFPLFPVVIVLGVLGLEPLVRLLGRRGEGRGASPARRWLRFAALVVLVAPTLVSYGETAGLYARNVSDIEAGDVEMARWLGERLPSEAVIATMDIGALGALLPNQIEDLAGIADPEVSDYIGKAQAAGKSWQDGVLAFVRETRPDYLVVFPEWLTVVEAPGSPFRRLHTIHVPGNVTLGRDTLALYSTPWTRYPLREHPEEPNEGAAR